MNFVAEYLKTKTFLLQACGETVNLSPDAR